MLKLTDIIKQSNILFTHNTINKQSPNVFKDYFDFKEVVHDHDTVNNLNSTYSLPLGSLQLPLYKTTAGESSIKYICPSIWNIILKELSLKNIEKYEKNPFWIKKLTTTSLKHMLKIHFLENY